MFPKTVVVWCHEVPPVKALLVRGLLPSPSDSRVDDVVSQNWLAMRTPEMEMVPKSAPVKALMACGLLPSQSGNRMDDVVSQTD
ncbi:hypothetical protein CK203_111751 [Vitis vinifera]|uniref:Uncharacterized protein n=1 Tax=Vitis vinifera TaxID=29760 RepID=A0A438DNZ3_VITVI|nr:hypothetical protein CK203_111751 [Vitis vinifera]